ncbi:single-stranded DNA-binding protein [Metamycoplasma hominis]|uniref:Single-stranded DNA-binding protein n=1 Tax=Metamycoplasma hominis TaxID=2098 RepID=A0A6A8PZL1_METHO|nr:single-stranded DNA-binding protein [Metamycoplasma hominis]MTH75908.1 single-stranded DNA-binding protein [Metamycoplasma hominis]
MNKVILTGRLVNDNWKPFKSEKGQVLPFVIALFEQANKTNFIEITCFNKLAEHVMKYVKKGDLLEVVGKLHNAKFSSKNNETIYKTEIIAKNITFLTKSKSNIQPISKETNSENNEKDIFGIDFFEDEEN